MRPEHLRLAAGGIAGAVVVVVEPLGMSTQVTVDAMGERLTLMAMDRPKIEPGDQVKLTIAARDVHVFDQVSGQRIG